jgi:hypothetical protein
VHTCSKTSQPFSLAVISSAITFVLPRSSPSAQLGLELHGKNFTREGVCGFPRYLTLHISTFFVLHIPLRQMLHSRHTLESKEWVEGRMTFVSGNISSQCAVDKLEPGLKQHLAAGGREEGLFWEGRALW